MTMERRTFLRGAAPGTAAAAFAGAPAAYAGDRGAPDGRRPHDPAAPGASKGWEVPPSTLPADHDEWGGFLDHVRPPRAQDERASDDLAEDWAQRGFRVPALALSPYSRKGNVHHDGPYERTSVLRSVSWRRDLEPLTLGHPATPAARPVTGVLR